MQNYPSILPPPRRDGYQGLFSQPRRRFEMDDGGTIDVRRWGAQPFRYRLVWDLPTYELAAVFEAWIEYDVNNGVEYVNMPLMGQLIPMRSTGEAPQYSPSHSGWTVSMNWESIDRAPGPWKGQVTWPATFPELDADNFTIVPTEGPQFSDIDTGLAEVRRRFRSRYTVYTGSILVDLDTRNQFWDFYRDDLQHGMAYFMAPFSNSVVSDTRLRARFTESPQEEPQGGWFRIKMSLETLNAPIMSRVEYYARTARFVNDYVDPGYVVDGYVGYYVIE